MYSTAHYMRTAEGERKGPTAQQTHARTNEGEAKSDLVA